MGSGDEDEVRAAAVAALGIHGGDEGDLEVLAVQKGRRVAVRRGTVVIKAFDPSEVAAFDRERAGLAAVAGRGLAVELVASGERWVATRYVGGTTVPMHLDVGEVAIHHALGRSLARLHDVPPAGLAPWSVVDRLRGRVADPPPRCPPGLAAAVGRMVEPLLGLVADGTFVHGDWGTANVLVRPEAPTEVVAIVDFEDAHRGDAAEDFAWQVLAGPVGPQIAAMTSTYGRSLGPHPDERLVVAGAEKCLDVLGWTLSGDRGPRFHERCRATLEELVDGTWPPAP